MVYSKQFAELSENKFSFYAVDMNSIDQLVEGERGLIQELIDEHNVQETPSLLFLDPKSLTRKHLHCGHDDREPTIVVSRMAAELE